MKYNKYWEFEGEVTTLYNQKKYREALNLLEHASDYLPKQEFDKYSFGIMISKAEFYCHEEMYEESINVISYLLNKGFACDNDIFYEVHLKEDIRYVELKNKNDLLLAKHNEKTRFKYAVHLPVNYIEGKRYPLFIALHGDPGNIGEFSEYWRPDEFLKKDFIFVYVQSSQLYRYNGFSWTMNPLISRNDIKECYNLLLQEYSIDEECVIIGGFSGGAITALDITFANVIPIKGFIAIGPDFSESFTKENVKLAAERGVRGIFMEGEILIPLEEQEEMIKVFKEVDLRYEFYVNKGIGHAIPQDLSDKLNKALSFICNC
ncbi:alpha/beta hydrolase [Clostridium sp.]|uniref:alpha/beta hydrolase n=1 Tax=Clostridium sp. TaxID=1506 RepID=UPI003463AB62